MKKKSIIILVLLIALLVGGGIAVWKWNQKKVTKSSENSNSSFKKPLNQLSDKELEKCLLEDFSRRLDLEKYFVLNLGELKTLSQVNTLARNIRATTQKLGADLTQLTNHAFKHLEKKGYGTSGVKINKRRISFLKDGNNDIVTYDNEWTNDLDQKITDGKLYIIFEKEKNYDWSNAWFQVIDYRDSDKRDLIWTSDFQLRIKNSATIICENKEKALEILKTDPPLKKT